jgi:4-amino-4-deoxy-L-arabinose transferase-like glycosyltransferase
MASFGKIVLGVLALGLLLMAAAGWSPNPLEVIFLHKIGSPFHDARRAWLRMALAIYGLALLAAAVLPLSSLAERLREQIDRAPPRVIAAALFALAAALRLAFIEADSPAGVLSTSAAFGTDEGAYSFLASEWAAGRNPLGGPEYLAGAVSLPITALQLVVFSALGVSLATVRVLGALIGSLMAPMIYLLGRRVLGARTALAAGLIAALNVFFILYQLTGMPD